MGTRKAGRFVRGPVLLAGSCAAAVLLLAGPAVTSASARAVRPAAAAGTTTLAGCEISGTARFTPGLTTTAKKVTYTFSGTLTHCTGTDTKITSGKVTASGRGASLSCSGGTSTGTALVRWNNGQRSTISYSTRGVANVVSLSGTVTAGVFKGESDEGTLAFDATATKCTTKGGVTSATFTGVGGVG